MSLEEEPLCVHLKSVQSACDFNGSGKLTMEDPSKTYGCHFPLEILSTMFIWGQGEMGNVLANTSANAVMYANNQSDAVAIAMASRALAIGVPFVLSFILFL